MEIPKTTWHYVESTKLRKDTLGATVSKLKEVSLASFMVVLVFNLGNYLHLLFSNSLLKARKLFGMKLNNMDKSKTFLLKCMSQKKSTTMIRLQMKKM